jgi:hypothetical protein
MVCTDYYGKQMVDSDPQCKIPEVQSIASGYTSLCSFIAGVMALFILPRYLSLSDKVGRKPIYTLFLVGDTVGERSEPLLSCVRGKRSNRVFLS